MLERSILVTRLLLQVIPDQLHGDESSGFHWVYFPRSTKFCSIRNDLRSTRTCLSVSIESPTTYLPAVHNKNTSKYFNYPSLDMKKPLKFVPCKILNSHAKCFLL